MNKIKFILFFIIIFTSYNFTTAISIKIIAKVENEIITNIDLKNEKNYLFFLNPKLKELKEIKSLEIAKNSIITEVIKKNELEKVFNYSNENSIVDAVEKNLLKRKKINNKSELLKLLQDNNIEYENFRKKLKIEGLWNQLIYQMYNENLKINDKEIRESIISKFKNKEKKFEYNLSEIVLTETLENDLKDKLLRVKESINEIGFENTANIFSISNTSKNGGFIGWVNELQVSKKINANLKSLKINEVTKPIKIQTGYLLVKLNDKKELVEKIDIEVEVKKMKLKEKNRQLNNYSTIYYKKLKKNTKIYY